MKTQSVGHFRDKEIEIPCGYSFRCFTLCSFEGINRMRISFVANTKTIFCRNPHCITTINRGGLPGKIMRSDPKPLKVGAQPPKFFKGAVQPGLLAKEVKPPLPTSSLNAFWLATTLDDCGVRNAGPGFSFYVFIWLYPFYLMEWAPTSPWCIRIRG